MKFRLKVASGPLTGQTFDLGVERTRIGGGSDMDVVLDSLSDEHALIEKKDDGLVLAPMGESRVFLNGEPIQQPTGLQSGDEIRLGELRLVLQAPGLKPQRILHQVPSKPTVPWARVALGALLVVAITFGYLYWQHPERLNQWIGWPKVSVTEPSTSPDSEQ